MEQTRNRIISSHSNGESGLRLYGVTHMTWSFTGCKRPPEYDQPIIYYLSALGSIPAGPRHHREAYERSSMLFYLELYRGTSIRTVSNIESYLVRMIGTPNLLISSVYPYKWRHRSVRANVTSRLLLSSIATPTSTPDCQKRTQILGHDAWSEGSWRIPS